MTPRLALIVVMLPLCGCAIAPSQKDVTGLKTSRVVRKIRCEAREAIGKFLARYLAVVKNDQVANDLGKRVLAGELNIRNVDLTRIAKRTRSSIAKYANSAIAMNFSFDGTEKSDVGGTLNVFRSLPTGSRSIEASAGFDRSRQNIQSFTVSDTFFHLVREVKDDYCDDKNLDPNYVYPIAGHIGLETMLSDFVEVSEFGGLVGTEKEPTGAPTMTFSLTFTTKIEASATPKLTLAPVLLITRTSGSATLDVARTDIHKLTVGFSRPIEGPDEAQALQLFAGQIVNPAGTLAEQRARLAIQQSIIRNELRPYSVIVNQSLLPF